MWLATPVTPPELTVRVPVFPGGDARASHSDEHEQRHRLHSPVLAFRALTLGGTIPHPKPQRTICLGFLFVVKCCYGHAWTMHGDLGIFIIFRRYLRLVSDVPLTRYRLDYPPLSSSSSQYLNTYNEHRTPHLHPCETSPAFPVLICPCPVVPCTSCNSGPACDCFRSISSSNQHLGVLFTLPGPARNRTSVRVSAGD